MRILSLAALLWAGCAGTSAGAPSDTTAFPTSPARPSDGGGGSGCADLVEGGDGRCVVTPPGGEGERAQFPAVDSPPPEEDVCASWSAAGRVPVHGMDGLLPDAKTAIMQARAAIRANQYTNGIGALRQCLAVDPGACMCHRLLGVMHAKRGDQEGACAAYTDYVCLCPEAADVDQVRELLRQYRAPH